MTIAVVIAALALLGFIASIRAIVTDGYRRTPDRPRG